MSCEGVEQWCEGQLRVYLQQLRSVRRVIKFSILLEILKDLVPIVIESDIILIT